MLQDMISLTSTGLLTGIKLVQSRSDSGNSAPSECMKGFSRMQNSETMSEHTSLKKHDFSLRLHKLEANYSW